MKLLKPAWVNLDGKPIFSVDVHPAGQILATGGMGEDCGRIVLWNMLPLRSQENEHLKSVPKAYCELTNHEACVNVVRWSPDGKYLASGSDDSFVMIWQPRGSRGRYGLVNILRGHQGDVLDLAWSKDGSLLATCSIDNTVNIWNGRSFPELVSTLRGHRDMVKGVTWDPVGKYLATQSTDKTLRIWRKGEWKEVACVDKPFVDCGSTTHVLRLSWSPDGQYIVSAHALNNSGPVAEIVQRTEWQTGMDFVGHRKAIEVARFNSHLFSKRSSSSQGCVALAGKDRSVSVWLTGGKRPLVVIHDLFTNSVVDASWSASGYELVTCSLDGTVAYMRFSEEELGSRLSQEAVSDVYLKLYGISSVSSGTDELGIVDNPELLKLAPAAQQSTVSTTTPQQQQKPQQDLAPPPFPTPSSRSSSPTAFLHSACSFSSQSSNQRTVVKQTEMRTKDGRRRITPMTLSQPTSSPPRQESAALQPAAFGSAFSTGSSPQQQLEKLNSTPPSQPRPQGPDTPMETGAHGDTDAGPVLAPASVIKPLPQKETPIQGASSSLSATGVKRQHEDEKVSASGKRSKRSKLAEPSRTFLSPTKAPPTPALNLLPVEEAQACLSIHVDLKGGNCVSLEVENQESSGTLKCQENGKLVWSAALLDKCQRISASSFVVATGGCHGSIQLFSTPTGRSLFPPFSLSFPPVALACKKHLVSVVTADKVAWLWNAKTLSAVVSGVTVSPLVSSAGSKLTRLAVSDSGHVMVSTEAQHAFVYHPAMGTWVQVSNPNERNKFASSSAGGLGGVEGGPLRSLQSRPPVVGGAAVVDQVGVGAVQYMEHQIQRSLILASPSEYLHWCTSYVSTLTKAGQEGHIKEFCYRLINSRETNFVGFGKVWLLDQLLPVVATNTKLQRVYSELKQARDSL